MKRMKRLKRLISCRYVEVKGLGVSEVREVREYVYRKRTYIVCVCV